MSWRLRFRWNWFRCFLGFHRLRGYRDCGDGVNAQPLDDPRARPGRGDSRVCDWCGARWRGAYDGLEPFWQRVR